MQEARGAGCRTAGEAERYMKEKKNREGGKRMNNNNNHVELGSKSPSVLLLDGGGTGTGTGTEDSQWDVTGFIGADILSEAVRQRKLIDYYLLLSLLIVSVKV